MDVADLLQLQRALHGDGKQRAAAEEQHVARADDLGGQSADPLILLQHRGGMAGHGEQRLGQPALLQRRHLPPCPGEADGEAGEHGELRGEGLGRGDADLRPRHGQQRGVGQPRHGAFRHVDDGQHALPAIPQQLQRRHGVGSLAGLADQDAGAALGQRRVAVAELAGDVRVARDAGQLLDPVAADMGRQEGAAAGGQRQARDARGVEGQAGQPHFQRARVEVLPQRVAEHRGVLVQLLLHEVAVVALADGGAGHRRLHHGAVDGVVLRVVEAGAGFGDLDPVALLEIGDAAGERGERQRVGAEEHLALAEADGERRPLPGAEQQAGVAGEDRGDGEGAMHPLQRGGEGFGRRQPVGQQAVEQADEGFRVGLGLEHRAAALQVGAQLGVVLDDAVVDHGDAVGRVRMGVALGRRAMRRPAGVADAGGAGQGLAIQRRGEVAELALGAASLDAAIEQGGDAGAVIATIFEAAERAQQQRRRLGQPDHAHDATHASAMPLLSRAGRQRRSGRRG